MQEPTSSKVPPPVNPPHLMRLVLVKVIRPFRAGGKPLAIGAEVEIEYHLARDLAALGKAAIVDGTET